LSVSTSANRAASATAAWTDLGWYVAVLGRVNAAIARHAETLAREIGPHTRLAEAVHYSLALPGKRFRPVLLVECCRCGGGSEEAALPAAVAVECVHTFSLIHDDLPAMDDDELRRGQPCNHKVFGEALAILAGDWLATDAFVLLAQSYPPGLAASLVQELARGVLGMVAGQGADVEGEGRAPDGQLVEFIHLYKTAKLIEATCRMGGLCAAAEEELRSVLGRYGRHLGLAFQITDDLMDATGSAQVAGKRLRKDAQASKQTFPAAVGIDASRVRAQAEVDAAIGSLQALGGAADHLRELARYVAARDR
jgi:geranylgeranyl diphosphate synthase type II